MSERDRDYDSRRSYRNDADHSRNKEEETKNRHTDSSRSSRIISSKDSQWETNNRRSPGRNDHASSRYHDRNGDNASNRRGAPTRENKQHFHSRDSVHRRGDDRGGYGRRGRGRGGGYVDYRNRRDDRTDNRKRSRDRSLSRDRKYPRTESVSDLSYRKQDNDSGPLILDPSDMLAELKRRSGARQRALAKEYGVADFSEVRQIIRSRYGEDSTCNYLDNLVTSIHAKPEQTDAPNKEGLVIKKFAVEARDGTLKPIEREKEAPLAPVVVDEEFNRFNQNVNPHNDYSQHYVDSGMRPQNFVHDSGYGSRFQEYPKLCELLKLKDELIKQTATPPMYMNVDFSTFNLNQLKMEFDVILISAPLVNSYTPSSDDPKLKRWTFEELAKKLDIESISGIRGFMFIWCGESDNIDNCRECIHSWNYRRCEDICWIKTNRTNKNAKRRVPPGAFLHRTKEHCLVGIRGTVKRSQDGNFIHANTDLDIILSEEPEFDSEEKPEEIFRIIEHFCLGRRRLHLFGRDRDIRPGWLTIGPHITGNNFDVAKYQSWFAKESDGKSIPDGPLTGCTDRIENLRPKTPPQRTTETDYKDPIPNTLPKNR